MSEKIKRSGSEILRRFIRTLLSESAEEAVPEIDPRIKSRIAKLGLYPGLGIQIEYHDEGIIIQYAKINSKGSIVSLDRPRRGAPAWGHMIISSDQENGPCLSDTFGEPWVIVTVESEVGAGWGPLLYDVAIEYASINGGGLMSDRATVSNAAISVWDKYASRGDVSSHKLDISHDPDLSNDFERSIPQETPLDPGDDCVQTKAIEASGVEGWMNSPLSRLYRKSSTPAMDALNSAGLLWDET